jgi:hypothetical protein
MSFKDFLMEMEVVEDEYLQIIHFTLKQLVIFLKIKPSHIWNNSFVKDMPNLWDANIDAQYVLNAYVATSYCNSYMTKVEKSIKNTFSIIHKEHYLIFNKCFLNEQFI